MWRFDISLHHGLTDLHLKPAPGSVDLAQILLHKGQGWQTLLSRAQQAHALRVYSEVVGANLLTESSHISVCGIALTKVMVTEALAGMKGLALDLSEMMVTH